MEIVTENATSLAWVGDAEFSLRVRKHLLAKGLQQPKKLQKLNAKYCSAQGQAKILSILESRGIFNEDEQEILRRGRNANVHSTAKNASLADYMKATALEALFGYLSLYGHEDRMNELLDLSMEIGDDL